MQLFGRCGRRPTRVSINSAVDRPCWMEMHVVSYAANRKFGITHIIFLTMILSINQKTLILLVFGHYFSDITFLNSTLHDYKVRTYSRAECRIYEYGKRYPVEVFISVTFCRGPKNCGSAGIRPCWDRGVPDPLEIHKIVPPHA